MVTNTELPKPSDFKELEQLCLAIYKKVWADATLTSMGRSGQSQFGLDLIGLQNGEPAGIQCKCYNKTSFNLKVIKDDVKKADDAGIDITHLLFATTADSDSTLSIEVSKFSKQRKAGGKFTVSIDTWEAISLYLYEHVDIGQIFYPEISGGTIKAILDALAEHTSLYAKESQDSHEVMRQIHSGTEHMNDGIANIIGLLDTRLPAKSDVAETNSVVTSQLDLAKDKIGAGRADEAHDILRSIKDAALKSDDFSKFRWYTNEAAYLLAKNLIKKSAENYLKAFTFAPTEEKALANRARAYILLNDLNKGYTACEAGLLEYPNSELLWAFMIHTAHLLKHENPEINLPEAVSTMPVVLHALTVIRTDQGKHEEAYRLACEYYGLDNASFDAKRSVLNAALAWASTNPVLAHYQHIEKKVIAALQFSLSILEPIEDIIDNYQNSSLVYEVAHNAAVAFQLLGEYTRAHEVIARALRVLPTADGLVRLQVNCLDAQHDIGAIKKLTESSLQGFGEETLITIAEVSANHGDLAWHESVQSLLAGHDLSDRVKNDLFALRILATWRNGQRQEAIQLARDNINSSGDMILLEGVLARMLDADGKGDEAKKWIDRFTVSARESNDSTLIIQAAELNWDFGYKFEAANLYGHLVECPGNDFITRRYLAALVESDQRKLARETLDALSSEDKTHSDIRRIEARLAQQAGDWTLLRDILQTELSQSPKDIRLALGYLGSLHQLSGMDEISAYLKSNPKFDDATPDEEFDFAKYQAGLGFAEDALVRVYRLFSYHPNDARIAGFYLCIMLMADDYVKQLSVNTVMPNTAILLKNDTNSRWVVLDDLCEPGSKPGAEWVQQGTQLWNDLIGKRAGDTITLHHGVSGQKFEIETIKHLLLFSSTKAQETLANDVNSYGPIWSFKIIKDNGEVDIEPIRTVLAARSEHIKSLVSLYRNKKLPLCLFADLLGSDPVSLLLEWPSLQTKMFVGHGAEDERKRGRSLFNHDNARYVLDLVTLTELVSRNLFDKASTIIGRPIVPKTLKTRLLFIAQTMENSRAKTTWREQDGILYWEDIPASYYVNRNKLINELISIVDTRCDVLPALGPAEISPNLRRLSTILDVSSLDAIYLCLEHDAFLISEDGIFRFLADHSGIKGSSSIQPLLMNLRDKKVLPQYEYSSVIFSKLKDGHDFISVDHNDLLWAVRKGKKNRDEWNQVTMILRSPTIDVSSVVRVCAIFLRKLIKIASGKVVAVRYGECLKNIAHDRENLALPAAVVFNRELHAVLPQVSPAKSFILRKKLGKLFDITLCL